MQIVRIQEQLLTLIIGAGTLLCCQHAPAQLPSGTNWALTFADEFNGTSLDPMKWSNGHPWDPSSSDPANVTVSNGVLNLTAVRVNSTTFTGAGVSTRPPSGSDLFDMTYGYVEARMQMPSVPGSWPAFWMLENGWPPELDICELPVFVNGTFSPYNYSDNIHYTDSSGNAASLGNGDHYAGVGDLTQGFHNYGMLWTPTSVTFYIDGIVQSTITDPTAIANLVKSGGGPMYLLIDNSGGGSWPGVPSESQWPDGTASTLQVDWVRAWKDTSGSAASIAWSNKAANGAGNWTDSTAWAGGQVPQLSSQTAIFGANSVNNQTVNWNNSQTVGGLSFTSTTSYTIGSAAGSLMLASLTSNGAGTVLINATGASGSGANYLDSRLELYNNVTIQTSSKPLIVGGNIIGTGGLTIAAGPITLAGTSTYTGNTTVNGGTLAIGSTGEIYSGGYTYSPTITVNNATLQVGAWEYDSLGSLGDLDFGAGRLVVNGGTITYTGSGEGAGNAQNGRLFTIGTGGATLNAAGTGTWYLEYDSAYGNQTIPSGLTLTLSGSGDGEFDNALTGGGSLVTSGAGKWVLTGSNTFSGQMTVNGGVLNLGTTSGNPHYGALNNASLLTINAGATVNALGFNAFRGYNNGSLLPVTVNGGTLVAFNGQANIGATILNGGVISGNGDGGYWGSFGISGALAVTNNATISANYIYTNNGNRTVSVSSGATLSWPGIIFNGHGATSALTFAGPGTTILSGNNTYSGGTTVSGGTLQLGNMNALGTGGLTADAGTVALAGYSPTLSSLSGAAGTITNSGTVDSLLTVNQSTTTTFGGSLTDGATNKLALSLTGPGTLILSGTNSYTGGTTVDAGTLLVTNDEAIADGTSLTVGANASLIFDPSASSPTVSPVPEPGTLVLLGVSAIGLVGYAWRRQRSRKASNES
ncbi:MAG: autotransporter-associated beta strand repeat-containing protein [Thermoguttaceae bacterium]